MAGPTKREAEDGREEGTLAGKRVHRIKALSEEPVTIVVESYWRQRMEPV